MERVGQTKAIATVEEREQKKDEPGSLIGRLRSSTGDEGMECVAFNSSS